MRFIAGLSAGAQLVNTVSTRRPIVNPEDTQPTGQDGRRLDFFFFFLVRLAEIATAISLLPSTEQNEKEKKNPAETTNRVAKPSG